LAYVVFSTGKVRYTSIYLQEMTPGADKAKLLLEGIEGSFVPFFAGGNYGLHGFCRPKLSYRPYDVADPIRSTGARLCPNPISVFSGRHRRTSDFYYSN